MIEVRLFAVARQLAERATVELELPPGATVADVRKRLGQAVPALDGLLPGMFFSVNQQYAQDSTVVSEEAEIACIPPVSGG